MSSSSAATRSPLPQPRSTTRRAPAAASRLFGLGGRGDGLGVEGVESGGD